jgi:hypothetical protein
MTKPDPDMVKAKPAHYGGHLMRSGLEVKVAARLDIARICWEYEPASYETRSGWYLPDFGIPRQQGSSYRLWADPPTWAPHFIEVKPPQVVAAAAKEIGLPGWDGSGQGRTWRIVQRDNGSREPFGICAEGSGIINLASPVWKPLAKPIRLSAKLGALVWIVGNPNQNSIVIRVGDGLRADRDCELFQPNPDPDTPHRAGDLLRRWAS